MIETSTPVEVFCCYSHADEAWRRKQETHLSLLQQQGLISLLAFLSSKLGQLMSQAQKHISLVFQKSQQKGASRCHQKKTRPFFVSG